MGSQTSRAADRQPLLDHTDEVPLIENMSVVLMGRHGVGKNTVGNAILKKKAFTFQDSFKNYYLKEEHTTFDRHVSVIRVPGWSTDLTSEKNTQLCQVIKDSLRSVDDGPHAIILVVNMNTEPAETTKEKLKQLFGDNVFKHILITSVDRQNIVVCHSERKQTIINRCKYHFFVRYTCGRQNKKLIETIEDFIVYKEDIRFYTVRKKAQNLELQRQDLANLVDGLNRKISVLSDSLESQNTEIKELQRLLKEKEHMLRAKEEEIERLKSNQNHTELSALHKQLEHAEKREEKLQRMVEELRKALVKSQNENKKRSKPSYMTGQTQKRTNSIELNTLISAETLLSSEAHQASEVHRGVQFLKKHRKGLIERIVAVKPITDELFQFIGQYKYEKILQAPTEYEQKRQLFDIVDKSGKKLQFELYQCLVKHEKYLIEDLEESP